MSEVRSGFHAVVTADGRMPVFAASPAEAGRRYPAVILYMDFWGAREELHGMARHVASRGYCCLVPDFYYRQGKVRDVLRDANGKVLSLKALDPATREQVLMPLRNLTDDMVVEDTRSLLDGLGNIQAAAPAPVGVIGYCLGGRLVLKVAAAFPDRVRATASIHPNSLMTDKPDSPHLLLDRLRGGLYFGLAQMDRHTPPDVIARLERIVRDCTVRCSIETHVGVDHGYALPDRDIYDAAASAKDWERVFALFGHELEAANP